MKMYNVLHEVYHEGADEKYLMSYVACADSKFQANAAVLREHNCSEVTILSVIVTERLSGKQTAFLKAQKII